MQFHTRQNSTEVVTNLTLVSEGLNINDNYSLRSGGIPLQIKIGKFNYALQLL